MLLPAIVPRAGRNDLKKPLRFKSKIFVATDRPQRLGIDPALDGRNHLRIRCRLMELFQYKGNPVMVYGVDFIQENQVRIPKLTKKQCSKAFAHLPKIGIQDRDNLVHRHALL